MGASHAPQRSSVERYAFEPTTIGIPANPPTASSAADAHPHLRHATVVQTRSLVHRPTAIGVTISQPITISAVVVLRPHHEIAAPTRIRVRLPASVITGPATPTFVAATTTARDQGRPRTTPLRVTLRRSVIDG